MTSLLRLMQFGASVVGSWLAGTCGAYFVWGFIYGIGERVVTDQIYEELNGTVSNWGGITGGLVGLAVVLLLRRPAPEVLFFGHALATVAGFIGGTSGWQQGLWAYFGALGAFVICVAAYAMLQFLLKWNSEESEDPASTGCHICGNPATNELNSSPVCADCFDKYSVYSCEKCQAVTMLLKSEPHTSLCMQCEIQRVVASLTTSHQTMIRDAMSKGRLEGIKAAIDVMGCSLREAQCVLHALKVSDADE